MLEALLIALSPFVMNGVMAAAKSVSGVQTTAGKRFLLAIVSILGVLALNALNGTPVDVNSISSLVTAALEALAGFLMSHGSYHLFWQSQPQPQPSGELA